MVKAATGQRVSIWTPGHAERPVRMPYKRLQTVPACEFPPLDGAIKARARELSAIGGEGQSCHRVGMSRKSLHTGVRLWHLEPPYPNAPIGATAGELPPIW